MSTNNELQLDDHDNVDAWMEDEKEDYVANRHTSRTVVGFSN